MLLPSEVEFVTAEDPKSRVPHRVASEANLHVVATAFSGSPDQRGSNSCSTEIASN